jgi:multisubunit Na+/H+ antiporter MnhG subunit
MSNLFIDAVIFILLVVGVGFGGIGVLGLLLFPDIRSRMFTAFRATIISISAIILAVIIYALFTLQLTGGDQYVALVIHTIVLLCIVIVANIVLYRTILERTKSVGTCRAESDQNKKNTREE